MLNRVGHGEEPVSAGATPVERSRTEQWAGTHSGPGGAKQTSLRGGWNYVASAARMAPVRVCNTGSTRRLASG